MFKTTDMFTITRILKKMDLKTEALNLIKAFVLSKGKINMDEMGVELIANLFENFEMAEKEITTLIASYFNKKVTVIEKQDMFETIEMLKEMAKDEKLINFIGRVLK